MKLYEVILSALMATFTTTCFVAVTYFYRAALVDNPSASASEFANLLEITPGRVIFMLLGCFTFYLLGCKWLSANYKRNTETRDDIP